MAPSSSSLCTALLDLHGKLWDSNVYFSSKKIKVKLFSQWHWKALQKWWYSSKASQIWWPTILDRIPTLISTSSFLTFGTRRSEMGWEEHLILSRGHSSPRARPSAGTAVCWSGCRPSLARFGPAASGHFLCPPADLHLKQRDQWAQGATAAAHQRITAQAHSLLSLSDNGN